MYPRQDLLSSRMTGFRGSGMSKGGVLYGDAEKGQNTTFEQKMLKQALKPPLDLSFCSFLLLGTSFPGAKRPPEDPSGRPSELSLTLTVKCLGRCMCWVCTGRCTGRCTYWRGTGRHIHHCAGCRGTQVVYREVPGGAQEVSFMRFWGPRRCPGGVFYEVLSLFRSPERCL